jgi:electron transport complex protein RnfD
MENHIGHAAMKKTHHIRYPVSAKQGMLLCLLPPATFGVFHFGVEALVVILTSLSCCWLMGLILRWQEGKPVNLYHPGSLITGLLIGMTCTAAIPLYMVVIGCCTAEFLGKKVLVNERGNLLNPAVLGRTAIAIFETFDPVQYADLSTGASPLFKSAGGIFRPEYLDAFLGTTKGAIGETSALILLVVGFIALRFIVLKWHAAVAMIATVPLTVLMLPAPVEVVAHAPWVMEPLFFLIGGPTLLIAFFFLTDPATTPKTPAGGIIFGVCTGIMAVTGKLYTSIPGVEMYGILVMNLLTPLLNRLSFRSPQEAYRYEKN